MGGLFGGGSSGTSYIPQSTNADYDRSVDADKTAENAKNKQAQLIAASTNGSNNIVNGGTGLNDDDVNANNKKLLGE